MAKYIRRYTELPYLLFMLEHKQLTLLSPSTWDDRNDVYYIEEYRKHKKLESILALCLTEKSMTYHHWRVFSYGSSGVCIKFHREKFIKWAEENQLGPRAVQYKSIKKAKDSPLNKADLPYIKRHAFKDEGEFRLIYGSNKSITFKHFSIDLSCIYEIVVNPWLKPIVYVSVENAIHRIIHPENDSIKIRQTTLLDNPSWKNFLE